MTKSEKTEILDFHLINELVLDRGPSPWSVQLEIEADGNPLTSVVGDGIIVATPTGSTAYSMSAGGPLIQPNMECMAISPLAPHSLSFRPIIFPASSALTIRKPEDNRGTAWVSLDGATRFELQQGESVVIQGSEAPMQFVTIASDNLTDLWVQRLTNMFNWNMRENLKPLKK